MKYYELSKFHFIGNLISLWAVIKALIRITTVCSIKIIRRQMWVFRKKSSSNYKAKNWKKKWHVKNLRTQHIFKFMIFFIHSLAFFHLLQRSLKFFSHNRIIIPIRFKDYFNCIFSWNKWVCWNKLFSSIFFIFL